MLTGDGATDYERGGAIGADTFILRAGDGGASISGADTVTDFQDGTDVFGLSSGIEFGDLTISQGDGSSVSLNHVVLSLENEYLAVVQNINAGDITAVDFTSTSTETLTLVGTSANDGLIGGLGGDVVTTNQGDDVVLTWGGNDEITVDGAGDKSIDGGSGVDTLIINYGSYILSDFDVSYMDGYFKLSDPLDNVISFKNIDILTIGGIDYKLIYDGSDGTTNVNDGAGYSDPISSQLFNTVSWGFHNHIISSSFYSATSGVARLFSFDSNQGSNLTITSLQSYGWSVGDDIEIVGTAYNDTVSDRDENTYGSVFDISTYEGNDVINLGAARGGAHTIDAGSGDDYVYVCVQDEYGYQEYASIEGGSGNDWLTFNRAYSDNPVTYVINSENTSGFENVWGGYGDDHLTGDSSNNILVGNAAADTIYGGAGDDQIYGYVYANPRGATDRNDTLYGEAGDDVIVGGAGDDFIDGGTGADVLTGDGATDYERGGAVGIDVFILRAGDGGAEISNADTITDFQDTVDLLGLDNGLLFSELTIDQGTNDYAEDTIIKYGDEYLVRLVGVTSSDLGESDFESVNII